MSWIEKLKNRWKLRSAWQVAVVLLVFACTGFTVLFIKKPLLTWLAGEQGNTTLASVLTTNLGLLLLQWGGWV